MENLALLSRGDVVVLCTIILVGIIGIGTFAAIKLVKAKQDKEN